LLCDNDGVMRAAEANEQDAVLQVPAQQYQQMQRRLESDRLEIERLKAQLEWFKRQIFGAKSEQRPASAEQIALFAAQLAALQGEAAPKIQVPAHERQKRRSGEEVNDTGLRFGPEVPVREILLSCPQLQGPEADRYEIIDHKVSLRLARQPGSHVVLKYLRPVVRRKQASAQGEQALITVPAPLGVLDHAQVDVSFLAGMLVEKFVYHTPLYRQHQKLADEGIVVSRTTLDNWGRNAIGLLEPIAQAVRQMIVSGSRMKLDETPIKAGRTKATSGQGKMKQGWLWPMLGEHGDIAFHYASSRAAAVLKEVLGAQYRGILQTDGYQVYAEYAANLPRCTHALCWAHTRRAFLKAEQIDPQPVAQALEMIRGLYAIERKLKLAGSSAEAIRAVRKTESEPIVDRFFAWVAAEIAKAELLPRSPLALALGYARQREKGLREFLSDAWLALDTNDLERALRVIPMGRRNWLFCSTEFGARQVATIQTLLATCRAHGIDAYTYLVDVLQRINQHPASRIDELTPRLWAKRFGDNPLRSDLATCQ
jgi:transposase